MMIGFKHIKLEMETTSISARVKVAKNILIPPIVFLYGGMQEVIWTNLKIINLSRYIKGSISCWNLSPS